VRKEVFVLTCASFIFVACGPDLTAHEERRVEETPISGAFSNAELIRNPASLREKASLQTAAAMEFRDTLYDFGKVREGEVVEYAFIFKNTGKGPLLISRARSTCGCTVPEWPEAPVPPGENSKISARFDTEGKAGPQLKPITIMTNTLKGTYVVYLQGEVLPAGTE
jgi:hypothetical protein